MTHTEEARPLVTQYAEAMWRHDAADKRHDHDATLRAMDEVHEIERKAAAPAYRPANTMPEAMHRLCIARGLLSTAFDEYLFDADQEEAMIDVEYLIDQAIFGLCRSTGFDLKSWRLDFYAGRFPMRRQVDEVEQAA